jgi:hypothetical protein
MDIFNLFQQELENLELNWLPCSELTRIGINGAASLIGAENGFVQKVHQNLSHCPQNKFKCLECS